MAEKSEGSLAWASENRPDSCEAIESLYSWASNHEGFEPFRKFLDLIAYTEEEGLGNLGKWANPSEGLGFVELGYMGEALKAYSERPKEVEAFITELLEVEREFGL